MPGARPMRADAARNRARILEAADRQITVHGPEVPMEAVAEDAGVAVGTLYRHFPTKTALVGAVLEAHLDELAREAEAAADRVDAGARALDELVAFARLVVETGASNKAVKAAARALGADREPSGRRHRGVRAMERIVKAGKAAGDLRPDLTVEDCHLFFATVPTDQPPRVRDRWFTLMIDGFRATGRDAERI